MSSQQVVLSRRRTNLALASLFLGLFVLGSAELIVVGVLDLIATDFGVSIPATGALVTAYALGLAIGGPLLTALTIKVNKRTILIGIVVAAVASTLVPLLVPNFGLFLVVRVVAGALQGLFLAVGFAVGVAIVPPERAGRAISVVVAGSMASAAVGAPVGTLIGQSLGWRGSFLAIAALAVLALIAMLALVPSVSSTGDSAAGQLKHAFAPRVLAVLGLCLVVFASIFTALTYIVPFLQDVTGVSGAVISVFLFAYGIATTAGALGGGRFADKNAGGTLIVGTACAAAAMLALFLLGTNPILVVLLLVVWGLFAEGVVPSLQMRVMTLAGPGGELAQALPASAANVGIALGPLVGGLALTKFDASAPMLVGMGIAVIGIGVAWATSYLKPPAVAEEQAQAQPEPAEEPVR